MSQQRYTPEFKDEAVRQVTEKGHSQPLHWRIRGLNETTTLPEESNIQKVLVPF